MQQRHSLLPLLGALSSLTAAAAGSLPRGVGPEFASYYAGKSDFACITNPSVKLSPSRINDNSCDCPDGSDEPGTAACAHIDPLSPQQPLPGSPSGTTNATKALPGFWCANKGHVGAYVPFSYVNDGVCDYDVCCDGSEEFGRVKCENRCAEIGKEYRALEEQKRKNMEKAQKTRDAMISEASDLRRQAESKLADLTGEMAVLEAKKTDLEAKHAEAKAQDTGKVVRGQGSGGKLGVLVNLAKTRVNELRETLGNVAQERTHLQSKVDELQALLTKLKTDYNPNFNDEGVKAAIKSFEDFAAREAADAPSQLIDSDIETVLKEDGPEGGVNWIEFENQGEDTDILYNVEAYLPSFLRSMLHDKVQGLRLWLIRNGILAESVKEGTESQLVKAAREAVEAAERKVQDTKRAMDSEQEDLAKDYGPSDIFRALKGKRVEIEAGEYTYELTWLEQTSQNSKKGHGNTNMGNFARIDREMADDEERLDGKSLGKGERMVMRYEDGLQCWNGPRRRTDVWLGCAEKEEVWRVSEAEKCVYKMEVGTPAACEPQGPSEERRGKDEL
ncbi:glucosidase II beta subunit-like domain-containing protein [Hirsutella rhossiliensis]|uniref:Glucosidase 2 subunit beta n=1 Tax=Hirsutella rhossiliensis TaxID=111463 RepID=A0A9P8MU55_9HYPO|nr:glucosidase II beta subunit-like domain-containing protein [Hirsutella rhossiliensis]KAH0961457.1 glucosidase II beta subunit-like domain-containing protein [Hirsutella rhossiliensis]